MRIDYEKREIVCAVGDLVYESTYRRIGVERGDGFRRMWIGQDIHQRRAETRAGEDPHYRAEVHVVHRLSIGGWNVTITGRVDGLSVDRQAKTVCIEEVKSIHFDLELEALYRSDKLQRHLYQLLLYSYFLSSQPDLEGFHFAPQLVLIDLVSGEARVVDTEFDPAAVAKTLETSVVKMIEDLDAASALRVAKRSFADALQFPFEAMRPGQEEIVSAVARGIWQRDVLLLSAPTGIGKTMAVLYPAVRQALKLGKKLFYVTSKTLQQEAAVEALRRLNDGSFRVLRIRAKQKMCANAEMICHEDFCSYAARYSEKMARSGLLSEIVTSMSYFDPAVTFEMSKSEEVCPFEVSLELIEQADVVVCDYNYIFDPYVGLKAYSQENDYGDCVLVVDEAHNLVDRGRGYYSPDLHEKSFDEIRRLMMSRNCWIDGWEELLEILRDYFQQTAAEAFDESDRAAELSSGRAWDEARPLDSSTARQPAQALTTFNRELFLEQRVEWERIVLEYIGWKIENRIVDEEDPLVDFYFRLVKFTNLLTEERDELAHIVERTAEGIRLKIYCKDPAAFLAPIFDSAHATVAMSATLEPFDFYRKTLGLPEHRTAELSLPSPFPRENRKIVVVSEVDTTYKRRADSYDRIATTVADIAEANEGNFLALFPSYAFLREVSERMPPLHKKVIVQRTDMTDYERSAVLDILRDAPRRGNLILAVSGGMYAEGVDYQGDMLSGVMVVGPALPQVSFEQELLKRYYDEHYGAGFEFAYLIPGMTRVVQSAGRVIRSEFDVGVIALLCRRFTMESYTRYFPADWYEESPRELVSKKAASEIRSFFEARSTPQLRIGF